MRRTLSTMHRIFLLLVLLAATAAAPAQTTAATPATGVQRSLAFTYDPALANLTSTNRFVFQGGAAEAAIVGHRGFGVAVNVVGLHTGSGGSTNGAPVSLVVLAAGPRYERRSGRLTYFAQGLVGFAHGFESVFPTEAGPSARANSVAAQVGGGLDLPLNRHFSLRLLQADWLRTQLPNGVLNEQNSLRLGAALVLR